MPLVSIAPAIAADAGALIALHIASRAVHTPWVAPFIDQAGFEAWFAAPGERMVAREETSGEICGVFNISQIVLGNFCSAYLGFYGMAGFGGRGLMTEGLRLTVAHAFNVLGLHRLEANIQPENARSIALVRRVEFAKEGFSPGYLRIGGVWRDHERWAVVNHQPDDQTLT
jgi:ribosomal-protein-alanine N-acetyltransferase